MLFTRSIKHFCQDPTYKIVKIALRFVKPERIPDKYFLKYEFHYVFGEKLNLRIPKTFSEKMQWIKLNDRNPLYTTLVDKIEAKTWIESRIGGNYTIPTLATYSNENDIDFNSLPDKFVLKCNHDSGSVVICNGKNKFDQESAKAVLGKGLRHNFYLKHREWPYKNVNRRILAEIYLGENLRDYRIYCFNGTPRLIYSYTNESRVDGQKPEPAFCDIFDTSWKPMPYRQNSKAKGNVSRPDNLDLMLSIAKELCRDLPFVRVDLYEVSDKVYVGEITLIPGGGMSQFVPKEWDCILGSWLKLPNRSR